MKYIYFFLLVIILSSCDNKQVYDTYKEVDDLLNEAKLLHDSATKDLELIHLKNDSLIDIYFPKE
jgi:hypothetical protein